MSPNLDPAGLGKRPLRRTHLRTLDLMIAAVVLGAMALLAATSWSSRLQGQRSVDPAEDVVEAVASLRRTFGYDGVVHDLERLRQDQDPGALDDMEKSLRSARSSIGMLRHRVADGSASAARALDQLESASRRLEAVLLAERGDLTARMIDLPVLEPLFVLDEATDALRDAIRRQDTGLVEQALWLTSAAAGLVVAVSLLLAGWVRLTLLVPLHRLALDVAAGSRETISYLAGRKDDLGILARAVRDPRPSPAGLEGAADLRAMLEDQAIVLTETRDLIVTLASTDRTNEPKDPAPTSLVILHQDPAAARHQDTDRTNEPKNAALEALPSLSTNEPKPASPVALTMYGTNEPEEKKSTVLHSIVEMVAKEQVRRLQGSTEAPPLATSQDEQLMAVLVDRVLARLDQVTERVNAKAPVPAERRAS